MVIGFEELTDGTFQPASNRPTTLEAWSQDGIQSIVSKYVEPTVQCRVVHRGAEKAKHPIIIVPGGHRIPVRARSGSPDGKLQVHRIYIRRPGPASEEPRAAEEWDRFFERCLQNRQAELVEAMRTILAGTLPAVAPPTRLDALTEFSSAAALRWEKRITKLPNDAPPRLPYGFYDFAAIIEGNVKRPTLGALREIISREIHNYSGWPPFLTLNRAPFAPAAVDGAVEFWRGPDTDGSFTKPAQHDFWRVSPDGLLFTRRGYQEDGGYKDRPPGTSLDITTPTLRIGEAILNACYIARAMTTGTTDITVRVHYSHLSGRELVSFGNPNRILFEGYKATQNNYEAIHTISLSALPQNLPEIVHALLSPLYELFDFFQLPKRLVEEELATLQRHRFS